MSKADPPLPVLLDRKTRTAALDSLRTFLSARKTAAALTRLEILKLWKGLFYALWMCDRPLAQQALCGELAELIYILPREAAMPWLRGFWATMAREWTGIDVLRMEKFLLLVRRVLGAGLAWMRQAAPNAGQLWDMQKVEEVLAVLQEWPFALEEEAETVTARGQPRAEQKKGQEQPVPNNVPVGLKLHVLDIWVDEAEKVDLLDDEVEGVEGADSPGKEIVRRISELVDTLERGTTSKAVRVRSKQSLADERLPWVKAREAKEQDPVLEDGRDEDSWDGFSD
jgi:ribosomal RNA-processing protein 1